MMGQTSYESFGSITLFTLSTVVLTGICEGKYKVGEEENPHLHGWFYDSTI